MPTLKQITCSVYSENDIKLREHQTAYSDGFVSSYIVVPPKPTKFNIQVNSEGYIAPGLAMYVFIDGVSQCNRNRTGLLLPAAGVSKSDYEVEFRVRQKEEKLANGTWVGREWTFAGLNTGAADAPQASVTTDVLNSVGTIEVVFLRCQLDGQPATVKQAANKKNEQKPNEQKKDEQKKDEQKKNEQKVNKQKKTEQKSNEKKKINLTIKGSSVSYTLDGASDGKRKCDSMLGLDGSYDDPLYNQYLNQFPNRPMPSQFQQQYHQQQRRPAPSPSAPGSTSGRAPQAKYQPGAQYPYYNQQVSQQDPRGPPPYDQSYGHAAIYNDPRDPRQQMRTNQPYPPPPQFQQYPPKSFNAQVYQARMEAMYGNQDQQPFQRGLVGTHKYQPTYAPAADSTPNENTIDKAKEDAMEKENEKKKKEKKEKEKKEDDTTAEQKDKEQSKKAPVEFLDAYGRTFQGWITLPASVTSSTKGKIKDDDPVPAELDWGEAKSTTSNKPEEKPQETDHTAITWEWPTAEEEKEDEKKEETSWDTTTTTWGITPAGDDKTWGDDKKNDSNEQDITADVTQDWNNEDQNTTTTPSAWEIPSAPAAAEASPPSTTRTTEPAKRRKKKDEPTEAPQPASTPLIPPTPSKPLDPANPHLKPYFTTWTQSPSAATAAFILPAEPPPTIPASHATTLNISHQLQTGAGIPYTHRTAHPRYLDSMSKPYAVFVFKYRSREKLAQILEVDVEEIKLDRVSLRGKMERMSKEQVLEMFMKAKAKAGYATDSSLESSGDDGEDEVVVEEKKEVVVEKKKDGKKEKEKDNKAKASGPALSGLKGTWNNEAPAATAPAVEEW